MGHTSGLNILRVTLAFTKLSKMLRA